MNLQKNILYQLAIVCAYKSLWTCYSVSLCEQETNHDERTMKNTIENFNFVNLSIMQLPFQIIKIPFLGVLLPV